MTKLTDEAKEQIDETEVDEKIEKKQKGEI